ncbi:facilitated trehalose transporter Tret1-like [Cataglyphis hispanica]|uniref:facilitated trehalose transporter Tret1-like n=1 Tax=Cataglyphis hispanica TaxID=1086592 RepID=UPI00217FC321|nr:facilitated trehalose transporter Tret1-like [Cataglyphis hispanica]
MKFFSRADTHVPTEVPEDAPIAKWTYSQVLAAFAVSVGSMQIGYSLSYTSPALVSMRDFAITGFEVTPQMGMWIGSIMPLSALLGGITGGPSIEAFGRRTTIMCTALPFFIAWVLIWLAMNIPMVLVGRAICGFVVGIASLAFPVYLGETIHAEVRGGLGLMPTVFGNGGILVCYTAGMFLSWRNLALLGAIFPIPFVILMYLIPETPRYFISKGKIEKAQKSLQWLRDSMDITEELSNIEQIHQEAVERERVIVESTFTLLTKEGHRVPVLISLGLMFFQQMSGINAVIFYTVQIFLDAGSTIDENLSTMIIGLVNLIATFIAAVLIDRLGRKVLLYISAVSMIVTLTVLGGYFYAKSLGVNVVVIGWLPLLCLIVYVIGFSTGFGPIPWLMMGEILPAQIRGTAASIATVFNWMFTFIVTKTFQDLIDLLGTHGAFWVFASFVVIALFFVFFCVPETRGKTLEEIERRFTGPARRLSAIANIKPLPMTT